jgi:hypothetical protein
MLLAALVLVGSLVVNRRTLAEAHPPLSALISDVATDVSGITRDAYQELGAGHDPNAYVYDLYTIQYLQGAEAYLKAGLVQ